MMTFALVVLPALALTCVLFGLGWGWLFALIFVQCRGTMAFPLSYLYFYHKLGECPVCKRHSISILLGFTEREYTTLWSSSLTSHETSISSGNSWSSFFCRFIVRALTTTTECMKTLTSRAGLALHVGGDRSQAENFADRLNLVIFAIISNRSFDFIPYSKVNWACPLSSWAPVITSLSTPSIFFLRIVDRSAAGTAFTARHPCARFRLSTSPHLPPLSCRFYSSRKKKSNKMPPKKAQVQEKVLLGRPGNNLKSGIVCEQCPHPFCVIFSHSTVHFLIPHKLFKPSCPPVPLSFFSPPSTTNYKPQFWFLSSEHGLTMILGWSCQRWQIHSIPVHHQVLSG